MSAQPTAYLCFFLCASSSDRCEDFQGLSLLQAQMIAADSLKKCQINEILTVSPRQEGLLLGFMILASTRSRSVALLGLQAPCKALDAACCHGETASNLGKYRPG